jgi:alpha-tubulin suppressor-like RCC1 family protein
VTLRAGAVFLLLFAGCEPAIRVAERRVDASDDGEVTDADDADTSVMEDGPPDAGPPCAMPFTASLVSAGESHVCAIGTADQKVYCWGAGLSGQLGNEETVTQYTPTPIWAPNSTFDGITSQALATCARRIEDGQILCWGYNFSGGLGVGGSANSATPASNGVAAVVDFGSGVDFVLTRDGVGTMRVWGDNTVGNLGLGDTLAGDAVRLPTTLTGLDARQLTGGASHSCILDANEHALCAGYNLNDQLGSDTDGMPSSVFVPVDTTLELAAIDAGYNTTCAISTDGEGRLFCWGENEPTIVPTTPPRGTIPIPMQVGTLEAYKDVSVGHQSVCALRDGGRLYCWGEGDHGGLGQAGTEDLPLPTEVTPGTYYTAVSVGRNFACAIRELDSGVVCFGRNDAGQLGRGQSPAQTGPAVICLD